MERVPIDKLYDERAKALNEAARKRSRGILEAIYPAVAGHTQLGFSTVLRGEIARFEDYKVRKKLGTLKRDEPYPVLGEIAKRKIADVEGEKFLHLADPKHDPQLFALQAGFVNWQIDAESDYVLSHSYEIKYRDYPADVVQVYTDEWQNTTRQHFVDHLLPETRSDSEDIEAMNIFNNTQLKSITKFVYNSLPEGQVYFASDWLTFYNAFKNGQFPSISDMQNQALAEIDKKFSQNEE